MDKVIIMNFISNDKENLDGSIFSNETITEKEGYEALLYVLKVYLNLPYYNDFTDIITDGGYLNDCIPLNTNCWEYWLEGVEKVKKKGSLPIKISSDKIITEKEGYEAMIYMLDTYWIKGNNYYFKLY